MNRRVWLIALACVLTLALFLFAVVVTLLGSERGTRWSLQLAQRWLPELSIEQPRGTWLRGLHVQRLQWRSDSTTIALDTLALRLQWASLLYGEVRLPLLQTDTLRIESHGEDDGQPIELPEIFLPTTLHAPRLRVTRLQIVDGDSITELHDIAGGVRWRATTLRLRDLQVAWNDLQLRTSGQLGLRGDYPLRLRGTLTLPQLPAPVTLTTKGDLRALKIAATTTAPVAAKAAIELALLTENLPLKIAAELTQPVERSVGAGAVRVDSATLRATGTLAQIDATLTAAIAESHYGATQLEATARWREPQLQLDMRWALPRGTLQLSCNANSDAEHGNCSGNANDIDLTPLLSGVEGTLSAAVEFEAQHRDGERWSAAARLREISGAIGGEPILAELDIDTPDTELWRINRLRIASGANRIAAAGELGSRNALEIKLDADNLAQLHGDIGGSASAEIAIGGDWPQLDVRGTARGADLRYRQWQIARATSDFALLKLGVEDSRMQLAINGLRSGEQNPISVALSVNGRRERQQWTLDIAQTPHSVQLRCTTTAAQDFRDWRAECPQLSGTVQVRDTEENWRNDAPLRAHLALDAARKIERAGLEPFCLRTRGTEACLEQPLRYAGNRVQPTAAHIDGVPLRWAATALPPQLQLLNDARAYARVQLHSLAPLRADAALRVDDSRWEWLTLYDSERAELNGVTATATLNEQRAELSASAQSPTLGRFAAQLAVADPRSERRLDGSLELRGIQLAGFAWLIEDLDNVAGEINGDLRIAGTAAQPQLQGSLLLKDGTARWEPLGSPFRTINADLHFDNDSAKLGGWFALGQGGGDIDGNIRWNGAGDAWEMNVGLVAGGLSIMPLPDSTVVFSPHVQLRAVPGEMHVNGYFDVASAEIVLRQLPPNTVDVSQDQRIAGGDENDTLKLWADLGVNLGDQFHLSGFGADVNLSGRLHFALAPGDTPHLTGEVKVPRGRYRAYGQRLRVRKGSFIFYGPPDNPDLNLEAVREMPLGVTDVVGLRVIGSLKTPEALLFSEPSMPDSDIAYYLLTGRKPVAGSTNQMSASGALLSLGMAGSEDRAGRLAERFGIRDLQLGTSEDSSGNTEAEISGQLGRGLYVRYGRGLGQQSSSIRFQYQLTPRLMIETISGVEDALDLLYSFEIK